MHRAKLAMPFHSWRTSAAVGPPPLFGSRCAQAWDAVGYWELLAASRAIVVLLNSPALLGSGKFGTPWERTQRAYARALELADPAASDEPPEPVDDGLALHAASRTTAVVAMMTGTVRAIGGHALGFMGLLRSMKCETPRPSSRSSRPMTRAEHRLLSGCHRGERTMCRCACWSWRITLRWPTGSAKACATPASPSTSSTTARQPLRALRVPSTTWSCLTGTCRPCTATGFAAGWCGTDRQAAS